MAKTGRPRVHPWEKWLNGETHELKADRDFTCEVHSMQKMLHAEAKRREVVGLRTRVVDSDTLRVFIRERRAPAHPWDDWLDGNVHVLQKGLHFQGHHTSFVTQAHRAARQRGLKVQTRTRGDGTFREVALKASPRESALWPGMEEAEGATLSQPPRSDTTRGGPQ